jgi:hypothetical protein
MLADPELATAGVATAELLLEGPPQADVHSNAVKETISSVLADEMVFMAPPHPGRSGGGREMAIMSRIRLGSLFAAAAYHEAPNTLLPPRLLREVRCDKSREPISFLLLCTALKK